MSARLLLVVLILSAAASAATAADCRKTVCRQMNSCEEAYDVLRTCGRTSLDGDGDGIPCEAICGRRGPTETARRLVPSTGGFDCAPKTCRQIGSCEEALHLLYTCGLRRLDRDRDGIPCEGLC